MRYLALACDYDGTLAAAGKISKSTFAALECLISSGCKLILVTGREVDDLSRTFPEFAICERIVAENGAVLYRPGASELKPLADPPPQKFIDALRRQGVEPLSVGRCIVATRQPHDAAVLKAIRELGLELQVIYNKGSVMVLPSGVNKGTGLLAALAELGLSAHDVVGVGDAENDHTLLSVCGYGVAVANAIPALKERADLTMREANGKGVEALIERLLKDGLAR